MNNRTKSEALIILKNKYFVWISVGMLILMMYNIFSVASQMQIEIDGGYYTYTTMTLTYLLGVVEPIAIGAFLGGFDTSTNMIEYKLCNQSGRDWIFSKILLIVVSSIALLFVFNIFAIGIDTLKGTIYWNIPLMFIRFLVSVVVWLLWASISFTVALLIDSPGMSLTISLFIFFGEQYIERFVSIPFGLTWNQKSLVHYFFNDEQVPFGVVQTSYASLDQSLIYIIIVIAISWIVSFLYLKKKYPQK